MSSPLSNIRVFDFGRFIAAPYCGVLLADMGADVIRIERPGGDDDRHVGLKAANGENLLFPSMCRNKRGITLDLSHRRAREIVRDLLVHADVVLHNFSSRAAHAFGLDYADVRVIRPDIIHTSISCFGERGPLAECTGFDSLAQMQSGAASLTGFEAAPLRSGVPWVDYSTGLCAALGTVAALRRRDLTGEGEAVHCALLRTAVNFTAPMIAEAATTGRERPRLGNRIPYVGPSDLYDCLDGQIYVIAVGDPMWRALMTLVGHTELGKQFRTDEQRFANRDQIDACVRKWLSVRTTEVALSALQAARIPSGRYQTTAEVINDPQVAACDMLTYADLEKPNLKPVPVAPLPIRFGSRPQPQVVRAPRPGEHNDEVYRNLVGYNQSRYDEIRNSGLI